MTIDQPTHMATALLSPLLTAALVLGIVSEHSFAAEGSDSDRGFANSPAVTLGLGKSGIDPSEIATYSQFAESLLADASARDRLWRWKRAGLRRVPKGRLYRGWF